MTAISPKPSSAGGQMDAVLRNARPEISKDVQVQRLQAVAAKAGRRASAPAMNLSVKEGNGLEVRSAHADQDAAGLLLMADLGTCDAAFVAGIVNQIAVIGTVVGASMKQPATSFFRLPAPWNRKTNLRRCWRCRWAQFTPR